MYFSWTRPFFSVFFFFFPDGTEEVIALPTLAEGRGYSMRC